jgi:Coenzyme PQQ synthesis protein D (PqqD)
MQGNRPLITRNPRVTYREFASGEGAVLLHLDTGDYFSLNRLGSMIWRLVDGGTTVEGLIAAVSAELEDPPSGLGADVQAFLAALSERGLIEH